MVRRVRIKQETAAVSFTVATVLCGGDKSGFVEEAAVRQIILILQINIIV